MGLFKKVLGAATFGLVGDSPFKGFRSGATAAAKQGAQAAEYAKELGQQTLDEQMALKKQMGGIYGKQIARGTQAQRDINQFYSGDQEAILNQAQASPFKSQLVSAGEDAIARNAQMTGGLRTGTTQENLAENEQNVVMGLVNQILQGKQGIAQTGIGATDAYTAALQNITAGTGATRGQIAGIDISNAAQAQNIAAGKRQGYMSLLGGGLQGGIAALSDERLKTNVVKIGEKHGLPWYTWQWNDIAESLGKKGTEEGHIAQEVQKVRPDLVVEKDGYLAVNYGGF